MSPFATPRNKRTSETTLEGIGMQTLGRAILLVLVAALWITAAEGPVEGGAAEELLPEVMSPMEKIFWGRQGWMRGLGYPLDRDSREKELALRRTMLTAH